MIVSGYFPVFPLPARARLITCRIQVGGGKVETMKYIAEIASAFVDGVKKVPNSPVRHFNFDQQCTTVLNKIICGRQPNSIVSTVPQNLTLFSVLPKVEKIVQQSSKR